MSDSANFSVFIPARLESTRLPGKVLLDIAGQPMLRHVHGQALRSGAARVVIATDNERIAAVATDFGAEVCMTATQHNSGTERICEAVAKLALPPAEIIVNLQADEPLAPPGAIRQLAAVLAGEGTSDIEMATLCAPIDSAAELCSTAVVKVVSDRTGRALYFSRAPIPWIGARIDSDGGALPDGPWMRHIGLYAYRNALLARWDGLPESPLAQSERLEQLRALWGGVPIRVVKAQHGFPPSVDTAADLARVRRHFSDAESHAGN